MHSAFSSGAVDSATISAYSLTSPREAVLIHLGTKKWRVACHDREPSLVRQYASCHVNNNTKPRQDIGPSLQSGKGIVVA